MSRWRLYYKAGSGRVAGTNGCDCARHYKKRVARVTRFLYISLRNDMRPVDNLDTIVYHNGKGGEVHEFLFCERSSYGIKERMGRIKHWK